MNVDLVLTRLKKHYLKYKMHSSTLAVASIRENKTEHFFLTVLHFYIFAYMDWLVIVKLDVYILL